MVAAAMETMVWSMNVIATAKIIAARIRFREPPPVMLPALPVLMVAPRGSPCCGYAPAAGRSCTCFLLRLSLMPWSNPVILSNGIATSLRPHRCPSPSST